MAALSSSRLARPPPRHAGGAGPPRDSAHARVVDGKARGRARRTGPSSTDGVKQPRAPWCPRLRLRLPQMDFNDLPKDFKCPPCGSGKNAFRPEKKADFVKDGFNAPGARAAKRANQQAFRAKREAARKKAAMEEKRRR